MLEQHLVCFYADDSGQQSRGRFLVVAGVAVSDHRANLKTALERVESESDKRLRDWHSTTPNRRIKYLDLACAVPELRGRIFYRICANSPASQHSRVRADSIQAAIHVFANKNRRAIHYEGLTRSNRDSLFYELRRRGLRSEVRAAPFSTYPEVRLADSLAAMIAKVHFSTDGPDYAHLMRDWFVEL